jgi:hypothetical protein
VSICLLFDPTLSTPIVPVSTLSTFLQLVLDWLFVFFFTVKTGRDGNVESGDTVTHLTQNVSRDTSSSTFEINQA